MPFFAISCQGIMPERNEVLADSQKDLTDHTEIPSTDTFPGPGNEGRPERAESNFIRRETDKGIHFFASGTEPFWSIDMDIEKPFSFNTMDVFMLNMPAAEQMNGGNPAFVILSPQGC